MKSKKLSFETLQDSDETTIFAKIGNLTIGHITAELLSKSELFMYDIKSDTDITTSEFDDIFTKLATVKIMHLEVDIRYRNKKIASQLIQLIINRFTDKNVSQFYLNATSLCTNGLNLNQLISLYTKFGFKILSEYTHTTPMYYINNSIDFKQNNYYII